MKPSLSSSSNPSESALRTFRYDPTLLKRGDPMLYGNMPFVFSLWIPLDLKYHLTCFSLSLCIRLGAYRRWKEVEINGASTGTDTKKKSGPGGKGKKNPKNAADKFYDALKKLGSGPADKVWLTNHIMLSMLCMLVFVSKLSSTGNQGLLFSNWYRRASSK